MAKTWQELTQPEKIEDLRNDVLRLIMAVNTLTRQIDASGAAFDDLYANLRAVEAKLAAR